MTDTPAPIRPGEVPLGLLNEAYRVFLAVAERTEDDEQAVTAAIAVALTRAREDIARTAEAGLMPFIATVARECTVAAIRAWPEQVPPYGSESNA